MSNFRKLHILQRKATFKELETMKEQNKKRISKFLSLLLRHDPGRIGLVLDKQGWAGIGELIEKSRKKGISFSLEELEEIVRTNDKKRFAFNEDKTKIRASQGHSVDIDLALEPIAPPSCLFHGTVEKFRELIKENGLQKMNRQHVHLSEDIATALKVGSRRGKPVILTVQSGEMNNDGFVFYQSENKVWLTDEVPAEYIKFEQ